MNHLSTTELESGLDKIRRSPASDGPLEMIVRRPDIDERESLQVGELSCEDGLVGDNWRVRGSSRTDDGSSHPDMQITIINSRLLQLVAPDSDQRLLVGDQLAVDLDLSGSNLPAGTQLSIGEAVLEVTDQPHTGCKKFNARFGVDALRFVNSEVGRGLRLRGINARVITPGRIEVGERVTKL